MSVMYVIQWKSRANGRAGKGTKLFPQKEARRLADELNRQYPEIEHEVLEVKPSAGPAIPAPQEGEPVTELVE